MTTQLDDAPLTHLIGNLQAGGLVRANVEHIEAAMLQEAQVDCPVMHRFGPGIYIREVFMPAGTLAIGHKQTTVHLNVFIKGRVTVINEDGSTTDLVAPMTFVGQPGRKIGYVHEDVLWQNVYATSETNVEALEATFIEKSDPWLEHNAAMESVALIGYAPDRADYLACLTQFGFTEEQARAQAENEIDQIPFPHGGYKCMVAPSRIDGRGLFATAGIESGEVIAPARIGGRRTPAGRFTNHAISPNARMVLRENGDIDLVASRAIQGCAGGQAGEEITIDYRQALRLHLTENSL